MNVSIIELQDEKQFTAADVRLWVEKS